MSVKLTFGEPVLVAMGPDNSVGWGPYQFPNMKRPTPIGMGQRGTTE